MKAIIEVVLMTEYTIFWGIYWDPGKPFTVVLKINATFRIYFYFTQCNQHKYTEG